MNRKPVVAYINSRLIQMLQHQDSVEFRTKAAFDGRDFEHVAIVYWEGETLVCMSETTLAGTEERRQHDAQVFLKEQEALRAAVTGVANRQGWHR